VQVHAQRWIAAERSAFRQSVRVGWADADDSWRREGVDVIPAVSDEHRTKKPAMAENPAPPPRMLWGGTWAPTMLSSYVAKTPD